MKRKGVFFLILVLLGGCVSNQQFDCPYVGGVRCKSMGEIEKLVDSGQLGQ